MENSAANTDLIRSHVITIILRSLQGNDKYGYEICREIEVKSEGSYVLKQPTLYSCLKRLESQGYITSYWGEISNGGRRRYYSLTEKGEYYLERDKQEWEFSRTLINRLLSDKDYDLTQPPPFNPSELRPYTRKLNEVAKAEKLAEDASDSVIFEQEEVAETGDTTPIETLVEEEANFVEEQKAEPEKKSFSIFDLIPTDNEEEKVKEVQDEDEVVPTYVVPEENNSYVEDEEQEEEESEAAKIIANAYDPYYGESYSDGVSTETAFSKLFDNNNSMNDFFGIKEEKIEDEEVTTPVTQEDLFTSPVTEDKDEVTYEVEENYYVVPNYDVSAYQSEQMNQKEDVSDVVDSIIEEITSNNTTTDEVQTTNNNDDNEFNYKNAFSKLFNSEVPEDKKKDVVVNAEEREIKITRDLPPVATMADLKKNYYTEGFNLKTYNRSNTEIYYNMNYMYSNKLNLFSLWITYAILLVEIGLTCLIDGGRSLGPAFYITTPLVGLIFPILTTAFYIKNPMKRVKAEFDFQRTLVTSLLLFLNLSVVTACIGFICGVPFNNIGLIFKFILLPILYLLNLPLCVVVYNFMFKTKKFHLN